MTLTGIAFFREDQWFKRVGSKSWAHITPGLRFILVSVSDLISETLSFSSVPVSFP